MPLATVSPFQAGFFSHVDAFAVFLCGFPWSGFRGATWTPCLGTTLARRGLGEGFGPCVAGVSIFFGHGHFATHVVVGQVFPLGILCLLCIFPEALAD